MTFDAYVVSRGPALLRLAYLLTGNHHSAEDLVQTALISALGKWSRIKAVDHPDAYLRRIILNQHSSGLRRRRVTEVFFGHASEVPECGAECFEESAEHDELKQKLFELPARQRAALVLRYYEDYDYETIAEMLGCSISAAQVLVSRGIARLRTSIPICPDDLRPSL